MKYLLLALLLTGCASNGIKDFNCYKVSGPQTASGPLNKHELEQMIKETDLQVKLFSDKPVYYVCEEVTPVKEPRQYPKGK